MTRKLKRILMGIAALAALALGGAAFAQAGGGGGDDGDAQATGPAADRARTAALAVTKGGTANAVERDSENGATWEVEITRPDGKTVDVRLDEGYRLVVVEHDGDEDEGAGEQE